jgi:phosphatidylinositol phospholipase C delta
MEPPVLEVETSSSSSECDEDESLIKEGLQDIKGGIQDIKSVLKKIGQKHVPTKPGRKEMSLRLAALLVYTVGVKCHGLDPNVEYAPEHIFSLSENAANKLVKANMNELITHTHLHLVRVYPKGTRVNSSNYQPHRYWAGGCQVVALNWQTVGKLNACRLSSVHSPQ